MDERIINSIGLGLSIVGGVLAFFYGFPQPSHEEGAGLGLEDNTPLADGRNIAEHNKQVRIVKRKYLSISRLALIMVMLGFGIQLWAIWK
jgi:hypothetical protein